MKTFIVLATEAFKGSFTLTKVLDENAPSQQQWYESSFSFLVYLGCHMLAKECTINASHCRCINVAYVSTKYEGNEKGGRAINE
jgi:hypothetical protein